MNRLLPATLLILIAIAQPAFAIGWKITGPCSKKPIASGKFKANLSDSVGKITVDILHEQKIDFEGNEAAIASIQGSAIGEAAIEKLSETKFRTYGWCYTINGERPKLTPARIQFNSQSDELAWFYAYSTSKNKKWTEYCQPAYKIKAAQFCENKATHSK